MHAMRRTHARAHLRYDRPTSENTAYDAYSRPTPAWTGQDLVIGENVRLAPIPMEEAAVNPLEALADVGGFDLSLQDNRDPWD